MSMVKKIKQLRVAIVGATGMVGKMFLKVLKERSFPLTNLKLLASKRSAGQNIRWNDKTYVVEETTDASFVDVDIVFFSAGGDISRRFVPVALKQGALVIDNTSFFRMDQGVPLVVPEVNPQEIPQHKCLIANPNCSTIQMVVALKPLHDLFGLKRVFVSTYQAVSGAGDKALAELREQQASLLAHKTLQARFLPVAGCKPQPIIDNVLPQIDMPMDNGYTREEMKMINETQKILSLPSLPVAVTCVRLPIAHGHSEVVYVELAQPFTMDKIRQTLLQSPGIKLADNLQTQCYPTPLQAVGNDFVHVGRLRKDVYDEQGLHLFIVSDNLRKGAATNAVQIAEHWLSQ